MAASSAPTTTSGNSPSSASRARPPSCASPMATAASERVIRTRKENLLWVQRFATIEELRLPLHAFKDSYNQSWIVERHGYQTPAAVRAAQLDAGVGADAEAEREREVEKLHAKIGQLTVE